MKKVKTQTKSRVATKAGVSVGHKIALSMLIASAFALGLNFAGMAMQLPKKLKVKKVRVSAPTPLTVNITNAAINVPIFYPDGSTASFSSSGIDQGSLDMGSNNYSHASGSGGGILRGPLKLSLSHMEEGPITLPARIIRLEEFDINVYNLCVPETTVFNEELNYPASYYYDINGTPYHDVNLTQRAIPAPCNVLLANAYDPSAVTDAKANLALSGYSEDVYADFYSNFNNYQQSAHGHLNIRNNTFQNYNTTHFPGAPLSILLFNNEADNLTGFTIPSRIVKVFNYDLEKNLCLPGTVISTSRYSPSIYFYDNNGTPYYDSLLTDMATPAPCNQLLANRFETYDGINEALINYIDYELEYGSLYFNNNFDVNFNGQGNLWLDSNYYDNYPPTVLGGHLEGAPMAISILQDSNNGAILAPRVVKLSMDDQSEHIICVPETYVPGGSDYPEIKTPVYFYDNNGTPYHDSLLTDMATPAPCNQLLVNKLDVGISDVNVNIPVWNPTISSAGFLYNFGAPDMHKGNLNLRMSQYDLFTESNQVGAPLAIEVLHGEGSSAIVPARVLVMQSFDGDYYTLCLPDSLIRSEERELYFYDNNGTPYYDSLMTDMATPKACNQLLANALDIDHVSNASVASTLDSPDIAEVHFIQNGAPIGSLDLNTNIFDENEWGSNDLFINPLVIFLTHGEEGDQRFPNMRLGVESGDSRYSLCVPPSLVTDYTHTGPIHYFYDSEGNPYRDSILTQRITCPPINTHYNIQELP